MKIFKFLHFLIPLCLHLKFNIWKQALNEVCTDMPIVINVLLLTRVSFFAARNNILCWEHFNSFCVFFHTREAISREKEKINIQFPKMFRKLAVSSKKL